MNEEVELKVCKGCDAPLPFKPKAKSFFKKNESQKVPHPTIGQKVHEPACFG